MSASPEVAQVVRQWVERAEEDLVNAEHTLTLEENCPVGTVCFHAQQCAEKYLKALLIIRTEAEEAVAMARKVREQIRSHLPPEVLP